MNYKDFNDYELIEYISENNEEANEIIFEKYKPLIIKSANNLYKYCENRGVELNDLIQEGMLGLNLAIKTYNQDKEASFYTYAKKCIERRIISLVVSTYRLKHKILNEAIYIEQRNNEDDFELPIKDETNNPENLMINIETENEFIEKIHEILTDLEKEVFDLKINGFTYKEISEILDKDKKTIDNAIQRIKKKIKSALMEK